MKPFFFLLIFIAFIGVYSFANYYLYSRSLQAFSITQPFKKWYLIAYILISYSIFIGLILERTASSAFSEWIFRIGTFWLPFMLYLLMAVILIDIIRIANHFIHFLPPITESLKLMVGVISLSVVTIVVLIGHINSMITDIKEISLTIDKNVDGVSNMKLFLVSDVHLGALIRERREKHLVKLIEEQKPDLVLICGDLIDSDIAPVIRKNLGKHIQEIETPMGVYAVTGNHEYIGGIEQSLAYLRTINVKVLIDSIVTLPNGVQIVGRNDRFAGQGENGQKPLDELLQQINHQRPIIVMNHQPYNLSEASDLNVDLHLSGHTHHGQFWPINYITQAMFELSWGYLKKGNTHFYVSSGYGTWGPAIRLGNRPEVVVFNINFKK